MASQWEITSIPAKKVMSEMLVLSYLLIVWRAIYIVYTNKKKPQKTRAIFANAFSRFLTKKTDISCFFRDFTRFFAILRVFGASIFQ